MQYIEDDSEYDDEIHELAETMMMLFDENSTSVFDDKDGFKHISLMIYYFMLFVQDPAYLDRLSNLICNVIDGCSVLEINRKTYEVTFLCNDCEISMKQSIGYGARDIYFTFTLLNRPLDTPLGSD